MWRAEPIRAFDTYRTLGVFVIAFAIFACVGAVVGVSLLVAMYRHDEPLLGAFAVTVVIVAGLAAMAYGAATSF